MSLCFSPLFSGSSGNCIFVGSGNTSLLVDAGVSGVKIIKEMQQQGLDPGQLSGILVTHEHADHIKAVGILSRKFDLPVYASAGTWAGMETKIGDVAIKNQRIIEGGQDFYIGEMNIMPFDTPHDAGESLGFCFENGMSRFALATDLGCLKKGWTKHVLGCDSVLLESNYDEAMLETGPYPYELKRRIKGNHGHLCNDDAAAFALELLKSGTRQIILAHLSKENNLPALARRCTAAHLEKSGVELGKDVELLVANRDCATGLFEL